jgi:hypothetical protein
LAVSTINSAKPKKLNSTNFNATGTPGKHADFDRWSSVWAAEDAMRRPLRFAEPPSSALLLLLPSSKSGEVALPFQCFFRCIIFCMCMLSFKFQRCLNER